MSTSLRRRGRPRKNLGKQETVLMKKIQDRSCTIGVVGLGYVGLPIAMEFARHGMKTIGIDVSEEKIASLKAGRNYIQDLDDAVIRDLVKKSKMLSATT